MLSTPTSRRRGVYVIGDEQIRRALRLPEGQRIMGVTSSFTRLAILVGVEGGDLPDVPDGHEALTVPFATSYYPLPAAMVATLAPSQVHTAILALLDVVHLEDADALEGRRNILERHAPIMLSYGANCSSCTYDQAAGPWPCPDYRDASAGLIEWDTPADLVAE